MRKAFGVLGQRENKNETKTKKSSQEIVIRVKLIVIRERRCTFPLTAKDTPIAHPTDTPALALVVLPFALVGIAVRQRVDTKAILYLAVCKLVL